MLIGVFISAACGELNRGVVIGMSKIVCKRRAACRGDNLTCHLTVGVVLIANGINNRSARYHLAVEGNGILSSSDKSALVVYIIILFFSQNVNI